VNDLETLARIKQDFDKLPIAKLLYARPVGYDSAASRFTVEFDAQGDICNLMGTVQGGILTAMLDNAMSFAVIGELGPEFVAPSVEIKTNYIAPAMPGRIFGEGHVVRRGRSIAFLEGRLTDGDGQLLATATATAQIRPRPASASGKSA